MSTTQLVLIVVGGVIVLAIIASLVGRWFWRRGKREPLVVRLINHASGQVIDLIKEPITVAVLDEVADVLRTGQYTRNIASALRENREQIKAMIAEKIKEDPTTRHIALVPFHDRLLREAAETTLRVVLEVLVDPRTDELVSDVLRDNLTQIRNAVREHHPQPAPEDEPEPASSPSL
jgi:hypothetical protein